MAAVSALPMLPSGLRGASEAASESHTVITANIRVPLAEDDASGNGWAARRDFCANVLRSRRPDILCLQEVIREPLEDLLVRLPGMACHGFDGPEMDARQDGYQLIAKNPILYSTERYATVSAGGFWLSETPHIAASISWGSARARHVNWVRLRDRATGRQFRIINTHLDHQSQPAREQQMRLILEDAATYAADFPQVFCGDFNVDARNTVFARLVAAGWQDTFGAVHGAGAGREFTAHAFAGPKYAAKNGRIDFILTRGAVKPQQAEIIRDSRDGRFPSDHYFVSASVALG